MLYREKATDAHLVCMNTIVDKKMREVRKSMLEKAYSLLIEKKSMELIVRKKKHGEHNVISV